LSTTRARAPINEHADPLELDDGTLMRTESEPPGTIGLDAKGAASKDGAATDPVTYARTRMGQRVGNGECFTLADRALRAAGFRSAADFGSVAPNADYVWGTSVALSDVRPGDVVQFSQYRYDRTIESESAAGTRTDTDFQERPHHTAIVERVDGSQLTVLEQNAPAGSAVVRSQLFFANSNTTSGNRTTTITVQGQFTFYRPQTR
jgi:hypothetical protein